MKSLIAIIDRQTKFSLKVFGPGPRDAGLIDHIKKELKEIEQAPGDLEEWIDVIILALDGAWRNGYTSHEILDALNAKQTKNEKRQWPDWKTAEPGKAIEHIRDACRHHDNCPTECNFGCDTDTCQFFETKKSKEA